MKEFLIQISASFAYFKRIVHVTLKKKAIIADPPALYLKKQIGNI